MVKRGVFNPRWNADGDYAVLNGTGRSSLRWETGGNRVRLRKDELSSR